MSKSYSIRLKKASSFSLLVYLLRPIQIWELQSKYHQHNPQKTTGPDWKDKILSVFGIQYIDERVVENVPMEEDLQLCLEDGEEIEFEAPSKSKNLLQTPTTAARRTPRASKRKREDCENDIESKFLAIADKQADAMKLLAESRAGNAQIQKSIVEALKAYAYAINNLAHVIKSFMTTK